MFQLEVSILNHVLLIMNGETENILVCPIDHTQLTIVCAGLRCEQCGQSYPVKDGIPIFFVAENWEDRYTNDKDYYASEVPFSLEGDTSYLSFRTDGNYGVVLDLGCGDGVYASAVPKTSTAYCIDVTPTGLKRIFKRGMNNLIPVSASGYELPFADGSVDTILYVFVVEHLRKGDDLKMLAEAKRVLKPGSGQMIYVTDTPFFDKHLVKWTNLLLRGKRSCQDHESSTGHINLLTMGQSRVLVQAAGLDVVSEHPIWMGQRFAFWNAIRHWLARALPSWVAEDYLTSKYAFVLTSAVGNQGKFKDE